MKPHERENWRYSTGSDNPIDLEEKMMFSLLPKSGGGRLLDLGCGVGTISLELQSRDFEVYGIDFSSVAIKKARQQGINAIECDVDKDGIPFEDTYFDVVWAGDVIEHVFDPIFVLKEINRVLIPGGLLLCTIPYDLKLTTRLRVLFGHSFQEGVYRRYGQYKHHTFFSIPLMKYMFKEASLQIQEIRFVIKFPKLKKEFITKNRALIYFAKTMVIGALSKNFS